MHDVLKSVRLPAARVKPAEGGESLAATVLLVDILVTAAALCLAWWLRFRTGLAEFGTPEPTSLTLKDYGGHIVFGTVLMILTLTNYRAYNYRHLLNSAHEVKVIAKAVLVWVLVYASLSLILRFQPPISRIFCLTAAVCIGLLLTYWRLVVIHYLVPNHASHAFTRRLVLVGWNEDARRLADHLAKSRVAEYHLSGVVLRSEDQAHLLDPPLPRHLDVVGTYDSLSNTLSREHCDSVLIADLDVSSEEMRRIAARCEKEMIDFQLIPSWFPVLLSGLSLQRISGVPVLGVTQLPLHSSLNIWLKRLVDIIGATVGLILAAPIIAVFGYLIRRESPGPIFYRQRRMGFDGRPFEMVKLRSMKLEAEADKKPGWTVKDDPRVLKVGKFMRAWNIDEIPQFWNVLKGDMSLVGPRPERPELIQKFKEVIPHYNVRHHVKPGMTGWAQVNGLRGDTDLTERVEYDLRYIESWNFFFDVNIMLRTFLTRKGAC